MECPGRLLSFLVNTDAALGACEPLDPERAAEIRAGSDEIMAGPMLASQ